MFKRTLVAASVISLAVAGMTGCNSSEGAGTSGPIAADQLGPTQLAAYSGRSEYPQTQPGDSRHLAAIVSHDKSMIEIFNFGDERVGDCKLWVNRSYVVPVNGIAPHAHIAIKTEKLYNSVGSSLAGQNAEITSVQIETPRGLENLQGPVTQ